MKFSVDREEFLSALSKAKSATEKKSALPVLNNFLLQAQEDTITIKATDLENFLSFTVKADVSQEGSIAVNADKLTSVVKALTSALLHGELKEGKLSITGGRSTFRLTALEPEDFPEFPQVVVSAQLLARELAKAIDKTEYAISKEDTRYALQGMYIHEHKGRTHFVGSDGHRLALYFSSASFPLELLLPRKSLKVIEGLLKGSIGEVFAGKDESFAHLKGEEWELSIRLLEGDYPDYLSVIPQSFSAEILVDKDEFLGCLKRLSAIAESSAFPVKVSFQDHLAIFEISEPEYGEGRDEMEVDYTGEPIELGFNGKYLVEALESFDVKRVWVRIVDPDTAVVIESEDKEKDPYLCLVMPMRI